MATVVRSQSPAVQIASVGEASRSSSQRPIPISATTLGTMIVEAFATPGNISQDIMEFVLAFADLWTMTGTMDRTWESARDIDACSAGSPADHVMGASGQIGSFELGHALSGIGNFRVP